MNGVFADLYEVAEECRSPIVRDPANRGRSWDQCYTFFQEYRNWNPERRQTLVCTPAYDKFFPEGLTACGIEECSCFRQDCFTSLLNICREHRLWQTLEQRPIKYYGVVYPIMRVVDMYFWFKGRANN